MGHYLFQILFLSLVTAVASLFIDVLLVRRLRSPNRQRIKSINNTILNAALIISGAVAIAAAILAQYQEVQ